MFHLISDKDNDRKVIQVGSSLPRLPDPFLMESVAHCLTSYVMIQQFQMKLSDPLQAMFLLWKSVEVSMMSSLLGYPTMVPSIKMTTAQSFLR